MATEILMPKLSSTMEVGTITEWYKKVGDTVEVGDTLFEVMTDKIAIEVESYEEGILLEITLEANNEAPVNSVVGYIGEKGEVISKADTTFEVKATSRSITLNGIRATPSARRVAHEHNVDLAKVNGSGRNGRIHKQDVLKVINTDKPKQVVFESPMLVEEKGDEVYATGLRKAIWDQMVYSKQTIPHSTLFATACIESIESQRKHLNQAYQDTKLTIVDFMVLITSRGLSEFSQFNTTSTERGYKRHDAINIGLAVSLDQGLVVPVIHNAQALRLKDINHIKTNLINKAKQMKLTPSDISGGTFTISSIGPGVVTSFTPIINAPEVAILGVGSMYERLTMTQSGDISNQQYINLSLSFDHRIIDGHPASQFLSRLVYLIENPQDLIY